MGLFDKFKTPKWKDKDWMVREEAVMVLDDEEILIDIAKNDEKEQVRAKAISNPNLTNKEALREIIPLESTRCVYTSTVKILTDKTDDINLLRIMINNIKDYQKQKIPFDKFEKLLDKIYVESILKDIALNDNNDRIRGLAISKIKNQEILTEIAYKDSNSTNRCWAINNITDKKTLFDLFKKDDDNVRRHIINTKVDSSDQEFLIDVAENDPDYGVRVAAVKKIEDEEILASIAINDSDRLVKKEAISNISQDELLIKVANNVSGYVKDVAIEKVKDKNLLAKDDELNKISESNRIKKEKEEKKKKQIEFLSKKINEEKSNSPDLVKSLQLALKDSYNYDLKYGLIYLAKRMESENCDLFALTVYSMKSIIYSSYDDQTLAGIKEDVRTNNQNIGRLKHKLGVHIPFDDVGLKNFVKKEIY